MFYDVYFVHVMPCFVLLNHLPVHTAPMKEFSRMIFVKFRKEHQVPKFRQNIGGNCTTNKIQNSPPQSLQEKIAPTRKSEITQSLLPSVVVENNATKKYLLYSYNSYYTSFFMKTPLIKCKILPSDGNGTNFNLQSINRKGCYCSWNILEDKDCCKTKTTIFLLFQFSIITLRNLVDTPKNSEGMILNTKFFASTY